MTGPRLGSKGEVVLNGTLRFPKTSSMPFMRCVSAKTVLLNSFHVCEEASLPRTFVPVASPLEMASERLRRTGFPVRPFECDSRDDSDYLILSRALSLGPYSWLNKAWTRLNRGPPCEVTQTPSMILRSMVLSQVVFLSSIGGRRNLGSAFPP